MGQIDLDTPLNQPVYRICGKFLHEYVTEGCTDDAFKILRIRVYAIAEFLLMAGAVKRAIQVRDDLILMLELAAHDPEERQEFDSTIKHMDAEHVKGANGGL